MCPSYSTTCFVNTLTICHLILMVNLELTSAHYGFPFTHESTGWKMVTDSPGLQWQTPSGPVETVHPTAPGVSSQQGILCHQHPLVQHKLLTL